MIWVCRAGQGSRFYHEFIEKKQIALAWEGYDFDLSNYNTLQEFRDVVAKEKSTNNRTSISNWAAQLFAFCVEIKVGDYILVPDTHSKNYMLCVITGEYKYTPYDDQDSLKHFRNVEIKKTSISKNEFSQRAQYSLGAFRTVFKPRQYEDVLDVIKKYID